MNIDQYKSSTGAKRFKRTKAEMALGLTPQEALRRRLATASNASVQVPTTTAAVDGVATGTMLGHSFRVPLDDKWVGWFNELLACPYGGDVNKLTRHLLNMGIGEIITKIHFPADVEAYEKVI